MAGDTASIIYSLRYAPPELVTALVAGARSIVVDGSTDVWSLGCIAYELMTRQPLFPPGSNSSDVKAILIGDRRFPHEDDPSVWTKLGRMRKLTQRMLDRDPRQRPSMQVIRRKLDQLAVETGATTARYTGRTATAHVTDTESRHKVHQL